MPIYSVLFKFYSTSRQTEQPNNNCLHGYKQRLSRLFCAAQCNTENHFMPLFQGKLGKSAPKR